MAVMIASMYGDRRRSRNLHFELLIGITMGGEEESAEKLISEASGWWVEGENSICILSMLIRLLD
jgi:hypothetical protein